VLSISIVSACEIDSPDGFFAKGRIVEVIDKKARINNMPGQKLCLAKVNIILEEEFMRELYIKKEKGFKCKAGHEFGAFFGYDIMCVNLVAYPD
jgi:hypothetical protein